MGEPATNDKEAMTSLYRGVTDADARAMLDFLIDHAGERFEARQIMESLGFARHRDVALAAYAIGEVAGQHGLKRPWLEAQLGYTMPAKTAEMLRMARGEG